MNRNLRRVVINSLLLGSSLCSYSATVTPDDALAIATEFMSARNNGKTGNVSLKPVFTAGSESKPLYYVFNAADNAGFVIISAESSATPVLGYSFESAYPVNAIPDAMQWMMSGVERELEVAPTLQGNDSAAAGKRLARTASRADEDTKLLTTPAWSQESPFNAMIPGRPLVGCVGTAMATIMKYHQWPAAGTGSFDGVDFNVNYAWDSMRTDNYRSGYTAAEGDAVATLMYHASKSIDTQYAMSGSSAYEMRVPVALSTYFGYDPGVSYKKRSDVATQAEWDKIVRDEIEAGRPVLYCGQDVTAGHAFVCDGYQGEFFHFNWGWGGSGNGYFRTTALNPTVSRTHQYNNLNTIIYNIKPATGSVTAWSPIHITADANQPGIGSDMTDLASGKTFNVRVGNLKNLSYLDFSGKIAVALCDAGGKMKALLSAPSNFSLPSMATLYNGYVDLNNCSLPAGTTIAANDCVRIMTQAAEGADWFPVAGELLTLNELPAKVDTPASFVVTLPDAVDGVRINGTQSVIRGWNYSFTVVPDSQDKVVTVKANGYVLTPGNDNTYTIANVCQPQTVTVLVQNAADVKEKRSVWVGTPGTLASVIGEEESGTIKELTLFGSIDANDFAFIRNSMRLTRLDLSGVYIAANGANQANAIPREAFRGLGSLNEVILPQSVNRLNNGCFRQCGITTITIPANVKTYEYNVFVGASRLRDIYVGRETAEFINWCVLSGVKVADVTLHVPSERAVANYQKAENWNTIARIIVDPAPARTDMMFAVMDNPEVKFDCATMPGNVGKGTKISFSARHIGENDNKMQVYANSTLLTADDAGLYHTTVDANTIVHFDLVPPMEVITKSPWKLTAKNGSIGLLTDAVNVIPGQDFTIRANAVEIPAGYDQFFWAAALTDANGNIKEFISPVNLWTAGPADNHKFNVVCRVNDSEVRQGNTIRLVTSANKKIWGTVEGSGDDIVDAIPALNNMTPVYNINVPEVADATVSGVPESGTAVRGRDITLKITPKSAANRIDLSVNGVQVLKNQASINYPFVAMEDMNFDIKVYDPKADGVLELTVARGTFHVQLTEQNVCATVIVKGEVYSNDIQAATGKDFAIKNIKTLDLRGVKIVEEGGYEENVLNHPFFVYTNGMNTPTSVVENILLPDNVVRIAGGVFKNCPNIKDITLPKDLRSVPVKPEGSKVYQFGLASDAFKGCTNLTTIRIPGEPGVYNGKQIVAHHNPYSTTNSFWYDYYNLGHADPKKVTVIVPAEYLSVYTTAYSNADFGNPWKGHGYNILSAEPVYGVNFDPSRISAAEDVDVTRMASFLGDNVAVESTTVEGKIKLINPDIKCRVYDNGNLIEPAADGTINLTFYNPAKNAAAAGNHELKVVYTHELAFNSTSPLFDIQTPEVKNEGGYDFASFDKTDALAPVLKDVAENSSIRFRVGFTSEHAEGLIARVMSGQQELTADADGYYNVDITNAGKSVDIFAVPTDGATLNAKELAAINPSESAAITSIALAGEISADQLTQALENFPALESLDLSDYQGTLPAGAFAGKTDLSVIVLPEVEEIGAKMFEGCTSLQSVDIPPTVNVIGEGAFKDCRSLETIRLTSIASVGAEAFSGCDNLTTITLLVGNSETAPAPTARSRASRAGESIDPRAFEGINPNCIIVLDEGVTIPIKDVNYITTATGTVTEEMPDGTVAEREGRIYTAADNINIATGHPLAIPHAFTLAGEATISMEIDAEGWTGIVVPFDAASVVNAEGKPLEIVTVPAGEDKAAGNILFTLAENGEKMESAAAISANTPYLLRADEDGKVVISAKGIKVPATPAEVRVDGKDFSLHATYAAVERPAAETYILDSEGRAFVAAGTDEEVVTLRPNDIYATSPVAVSEIVVTLPAKDIVTGIEDEKVAIADLSIAREGSSLVIYSPESRTMTLYGIDGRAISTLRLNAGRNVVDSLEHGVYILANTKILF